MSETGLTIRDRLRVLRRSALARLRQADRLDAGTLELIAHAGEVLAALDAEAMETVPPVPGDRAIVSDDGREIAIVVYSADRRGAAAVLSPVAALRLASQLLIAGVRRL